VLGRCSSRWYDLFLVGSGKMLTLAAVWRQCSCILRDHHLPHLSFTFRRTGPHSWCFRLHFSDPLLADWRAHGRSVRSQKAHDRVRSGYGHLYGHRCRHFKPAQQHAGYRRSWCLHIFVQLVLSYRLPRTHIPVCERDKPAKPSSPNYRSLYWYCMALQFLGKETVCQKYIPKLTKNRSPKLRP